MLSFGWAGVIVAVSSYRLFLVLAAAATVGLALTLARKRGGPTTRTLLVVLVMAISVPVGARLLSVLTDTDQYALLPQNVLSLDLTGFSLFGGLVLAAVSGVLACRVLSISLLRLADAVAPALGLGIAIVRVGCFLSGCSFGTVSDLPWAVTFPVGSDAHIYQLLNGSLFLSGGHSLPVHPTQLYESAAALAGVALSVWVWRRRTSPGAVFAAFAVWFNAFRLGDHFLRVQQAPLSVPDSFYPSLYALLLGAAAAWLVRQYALRRQSAGALGRNEDAEMGPRKRVGGWQGIPLNSSLRTSRRRQTHPRSGFTTILGILGVVAMFTALATAYTGRLVWAKAEIPGAAPFSAAPVVNADFPPGDIAGRWTGTMTLTDVKAYGDIEIPDPFDSTKPPTILTKEECEKNAKESLGKPSPISIEFQPQSASSGQAQFVGSDNKPQVASYQLSGASTTLDMTSNGAVIRLQGQITVQGANYVQSGPLDLTLGSEGKTLLSMTGTWTVSKPAPPGAVINTTVPATAAPATATPPAKQDVPAVVPAKQDVPDAAPTAPAVSKEPRTDAPPTGVVPGKPGTSTSFVPSSINEILNGRIPAIGGIPGADGGPGLPGPDTLGQALTGVLAPGLIGLAGALLGGLLGGGSAPAPVAPPQSPPDFGTPPGPKKPEGDDAPPPPPQKPSPTKDDIAKRHAKTLDDIAKANKEATDANSAWGLFKGTGSNAGKEFTELGTTVKEGVVSVTKDLTQAAKDIKQDPGLILETLKGSTQTVKDGVVTAGNLAKNAWDAATLENMKAVGKGILDTVTDPKKMWDFVKSASGYDNFTNAMDPNRSLVERVGQVGLGVVNLWGSLTAAEAAGNLIKSGGSALIKREAEATAISSAEKATAESAVSKAGLKEGVNSDQIFARRGGKSLVSAGSDVVADTQGIPKSQLDKMQQIAKESGYEIGVRPPASEAGAMLESGSAVPKPPTIHNKSIGELDHFLGAPEGSDGMVGHFRPEMPPQGTIPQGMEKQVKDRFNERMTEYIKNDQYIRDMESKGYKVIDGVVHDVSSGVPKPVVSDVDLAGIFKDGKPVPEDQARWIVQRIRKECPGVTHPDINSWYATGKENANIMTGTLGKHVEGGVAITTIGPNGVGAGFIQ
ncbi:MAG: prolipoprotein diacylglyceryl transferase [Dehalococcoidia bacterium]|nr:prolipoprotein diacylglyceryl transferase [Dehalococcoidia bacterium]